MSDRKPWTYVVAKWHAFIFSIMFVLYGGVKIVLGILDRQYNDISAPFIFLLIGIILLTISYAFRDTKLWSWYSLVGLNAIIVVLALFSLGDILNVVVMVFSLFVLVALFAPKTKMLVFKND